MPNSGAYAVMVATLIPTHLLQEFYPLRKIRPDDLRLQLGIGIHGHGKERYTTDTR